MSDIIIRELETNAEYLAAEEIQRATWGMPDLETVSYTHLDVYKRQSQRSSASLRVPLLFSVFLFLPYGCSTRWSMAAASTAAWLLRMGRYWPLSHSSIWSS